jgi:CxxC motif-containing protein (DUF1111 family)
VASLCLQSRPSYAQSHSHLHDGRTKDLVLAIEEHRGGKGPKLASEANDVVKRFDRLSKKDKQDLLNFLRSL